MPVKILVRAVTGRIARTSYNGRFIPHDEFVEVELTMYIERLLYVHGDLEVEPPAQPKQPLQSKEV